MELPWVPSAPSSLPEASLVLAIAARFGDSAAGCGGALSLHAAAGAHVHVAVFTGAQLGGDLQLRHAESRAAATVLGVLEPAFWDPPDGRIVYGEALVRRIVQLISDIGAQLIYAPSLWENHPDHRAVALAALEAARRCKGCAVMAYEVGAALRPNLLIDITPVVLRKREAMACFTTQVPLLRYDAQIAALNVFRSYSLSTEVEAAEAFEHYDAHKLSKGGQPFLQSEYQRQRSRELMVLPQDAALVSILIRSVDRPDQLDRALNSVAAQTWPRIEVVVVNAKGAGHRALPEWCGGFPLRFVDSPNALHRSAAANKALDHAVGDALLFLDDDDWLDPDHVHKLASALAQQPGAVATVTGARGLDDEGRLVNEWHGEFFHRLMLANQMPIMSVLFRRPVLAGAIRFDEEIDVFEDWDFWLQLAAIGRFAKVSGSSANYFIRLTDGSGVHDEAVARAALRRIRDKWRGRWPDAWLDALRKDLDQQADRLGATSAKVAQLQHQEQVAAHVRIEADRSWREQVATLQHLRNLAEHARKVAEQQRDMADQLRGVAEHQRDISENNRVLGEQIRDEEMRNCFAARNAVDALQKEIDALRRSSSWQITRPLRMVGALVRRLRGR